MKNIYLKAFLKAVAGMFLAALVFASCDDADKICDDADKIDVSTGELNGHEWVDLGLSVRWATCNVGASVPSDCGDYYAWGEIETKAEYTEENSVTSGVFLGNISGNPQYDAATANWGEGWRMPTKQELQELVDRCVWEWTSQGTHYGYKVTGPNGNSIFLPAAGYRNESLLKLVGEGGYYSSSTPVKGNTQYARFLCIFSSSYFVFGCGRSSGYTVRPVTDKSFTTPGQGSGNESGGQTEDYYEIVVSNELNEAFSIAIEMQSDWWIENTARWFSVAPLSGEAGLCEIVVNVIEVNTGNAARSAEFVIYDGDRLIYVTVIQPEGETVGELNGHEWVDLGLSVRWAACNVGASVPSDYGDYYAWGEIETKTEYTEENSVTSGVYLDNISGNPQYDAATANWGEGWRMPTKEEYRELLEECVWVFTTDDSFNVIGKIIGPNGNSIFLPAAGYRYRSSLYYVGEYCYYWSSTPYESDAQYAYYFDYNGTSVDVDWYCRYRGYSVRPVTDK